MFLIIYFQNLSFRTVKTISNVFEGLKTFIEEKNI